MFTVKKFLGCFRLEIGAYVAAGIEIISLIVGLVAFVAAILSNDLRRFLLGNDASLNFHIVYYSVCCLGIFAMFDHIPVCCLLIRAAKKGNPEDAKKWLKMQKSFIVMAHIAAVFVTPYKIQLLIVEAMCVYLWISVRSLMLQQQATIKNTKQILSAIEMTLFAESV